MTNKTIRRSIAFRHDDIDSGASPGGAIEDFAITYDNNAKHVIVDATRSRDMLEVRFEFPGCEFWRRPNRIMKPSASTKAIIILRPQHIAETIWDQEVTDDKASRLAARPTRLVFALPAGRESIRLRIDEIFRVIAQGDLQVSDCANSKLENNLPAQLDLLKETDWANFTADDLVRRLREVIQPPADDETSLELFAMMSLSTSEKAKWDFSGSPPWSRRGGRVPKLDQEPALHTIRLLNGAEAGLRALHSRRFGDNHKGLVSDADLDNAGKQTKIEKLMALLPRHHRDLVAQTSIPGLPALLALSADGQPDGRNLSSRRMQAKKRKTGLPHSRVVSPGFPIGYLGEGKDLGITLTQPYERAQIALTSQGATIDLRYAGEPPLMDLKTTDGQFYRGFNVEVSDYLTSLAMDYRVETAEKGYLFPLGIRCSLITLVTRDVKEKQVDGEDKRISRAEKITLLKMTSGPKLVNGPYCPFDGRWLPANTISMRTLVTPPLVKGDNWLEQAIGDYAMFWPQVEDERGNTVDFEFEWETDDGIARSNLLFVLNEYIVDDGLMRALAEKYNSTAAIRPNDTTTLEEKQLLARKTVHFAGTRHRYAATEQRASSDLPEQDSRDRGQTSFETKSWILNASGRVDETKFDPTKHELPGLDEQDFTMDGRMEGASQPPFYPVLRCANIRVQSADMMMGKGSGAIAVDYYPPYVIEGFDRQATKEISKRAEIFMRTIGGQAGLDAGDSANRSGGVASFSAPIAALSRKIGVIGGQKIDHAKLGEKQYKFDKAEQGYFAANEFLKAKSKEAQSNRVETSFSLVLGSLDLVNLAETLIDQPDVPKLLQQVELAPKIEEEFKRGAEALDEALYGRNGLAEKIADGISDLNFGGLKPNDLLANYWKTLQDMGFVNDPDRDPQPPFRDKIQAVIDTNTGSTAEDILEFVKAVESFADETAAFVQNPVPETVLKSIREIERLLEAAKTGQLVDALWKDALEPENRLETEIKSALAVGFNEFFEWHPDLVKLLFGRDVTAEELQQDPAGLFEGVGKRLYGGSFTALRENLTLLFGMLGQLKLPTVNLPDQAVIDLIVQDAFRSAADLIAAPASQSGAVNEDLRDPVVQLELAEKVRTEIQNLVCGALAEVRIDDLEDLRNTLENRKERIKRESNAKLKDVIATFLKKKVSQLSQDKRDKITDKLHDWLLEEVLTPYVFVPLEQAHEVVDEAVKDARSIHGMLITSTTQALLELYDLSKIQERVLQVQDLEEQLRAGIVALADTIIGKGTDQYGMLLDIRKKVADWSPPSGLPWPDDVLRDDLLVLIGDPEQLPPTPTPATGLIGLQVKLQELRDDIVAADSNTTTTLELLEMVVEALKLRGEGVTVIAQIAARIFAFKSGKANIASPGTDLPTGIIPDIAALAQLYLPLADLSKYQSINDAVKGIKDEIDKLDPIGKYTSKRIACTLQALKDDAAIVQARLAATPDAERLAGILADEAPALLAHIDTSLVGDLAAYYTLPDKLFTQFETASKDAIQALWKAGTPPIETAIALLKTSAANAKQEVVALQNGPLAPYLNYILGESGNELKEIENALGTLEQACTKAEALLGNIPDTPAGVRAKLDEMVQAISDAMSALKDVLDRIEVRNGKQILDNIVTSLLNSVRRAVEELVRELLPSKLSADYEWTTNLCEVASKYDAIGFCPGGLDMSSGAFGTTRALNCDDTSNCKKEDIHLATKAKFEMDLFEGKLSSEISGRIAPMRIVFPSPSLHMATIVLEETTFRSVDGKAPDFNVTIHEVTMGEALNFLSPLQKWLVPGESGIYITPRSNSITVGFRYDAGMINLGAVRFLNLVFDIYAKLPFTGDKARFGFKLSSDEWPFLVVSEPYGGGGFLELEVYGDGQLAGMKLVVFFGAVSQVQFGPIKASGRVVCGLYVEDPGNTGSKEMRAFFEIAGRASVASFSLSLTFIVYLAQKGKDMYGRAELTIRIKRGFVKFEFKTNVDQRIKGKGSKKALTQQASEAIVEGKAVDPDDPTIIVELPNKLANWRYYKELFA